jgi:anti-sigma B factor antagonist
LVTILDVETEERDGLVRIALRGELDLSTVRQVEEEITRAETSNPPLIVLDLGSLRFLDSTGLRLIMTADQRARDQGRRVAIVRGPDSVNRVFTITKLGDRLEIVDDISALA